MALSSPRHRQARRSNGVPADCQARSGRRQAFFRKILQDQPLLGPHKIGRDGANVYPPAIADASKAGLTPSRVTPRVSKHLLRGVESDHFHVKKNMPKIGGFQSFATAARTIAGFEAMLLLLEFSVFSFLQPRKSPPGAQTQR
jgi:transposase, IS6 family